MTVAFRPEVVEELERIAARYPRREAALLPALRLLEREFGAVTEEGMLYVSRLLGVPPAHTFGVFSFYTHYRRPTDGRYVLQVCSTLPCALRGADRLCVALCERLGVRPGETTPDGLFTLKKVECLAACDHAPVIQVNEDYVFGVSESNIEPLLRRLRAGESVALPGGPPPRPLAGKYPPVLLEHVHEEGSETLGHYRARGGYEAARKALTGMTPQEVIECVKASGLRGRGGAGFSTGMKWGFIDPKNPKPKYLICNADESEPGTFKDRMLIDRDPHAILEGMIIAAYAVGAHDTYIYIRGEFGPGYRTLVRAVEEAERAGLLGENLFGTGYAVRVTVHRGAGAYICGEETGLLSSLEGKRGYPKIKPPFPAVEGYFRCPTIVNNVETLANVPRIILRGPDWFRSLGGTEKAPGMRIFCVSGHVRRPGLYEAPLNIRLRELIYDLAGGMMDERPLKAVVPGGISAPVLTAEEIDVAMDFESLAAAKTMGGSGGVIVMNSETCMVRALWNTLRFFHHESCGQCTPCREGTGWLEKIVRRIELGEGKPEDVDLLAEVAQNMCGRTICVLADAAAMPTLSYVPKFRDEFDRHIRERGCPLRAEVAVHG